tara:strand:+ start:256 stop:477 length:222 start_codon:yes stop_codon:yes gene_type:complete
MRTDRKKDLDTYYNDHLKMKIIRRLQMISSWSEIMGIDSAVWEALNKEDQAEQDQQKEFEEWKKTQPAEPNLE